MHVSLKAIRKSLIFGKTDTAAYEKRASGMPFSYIYQ